MNSVRTAVEPNVPGGYGLNLYFHTNRRLGLRRRRWQGAPNRRLTLEDAVKYLHTGTQLLQHWNGWLIRFPPIEHKPPHIEKVMPYLSVLKYLSLCTYEDLAKSFEPVSEDLHADIL